MSKVIMVQGTMSSAGKSFLTAGLCRVFHQDGFRAVPFKSQNMALNSFVTKEGLEMGRAQVMQAEAAGVEPISAMNPILLKPTSDTGSQVIVNGKSRGNMDARTYFAYKKSLMPEIRAAFRTLEENADIIVIEGAGSPAEINLKENDIVNMGLARAVNAPVLLVGDIDRGGVFAQLVGTLELLDPEERARVTGLVINKFRGDGSLLDSGVQFLTEKTGVPTVGILPYLRVRLDDEDSLSARLTRRDRAAVDIAVIRLPHISNFTDFDAFDEVQGAGVRYVTHPTELGHPDLCILPGTKNTVGDLRWLWESGLADAVKVFSETGPVLGICGGYQMLGEEVSDPDHTEEGGKMPGLSLLPVRTVLQPEKTLRQSTAILAAAEGVFVPLAGTEVHGYEIHMGRTSWSGTPGAPFLRKKGADPDADASDGAVQGNVCGTYLHGLFDAGNLAWRVADLLARKKGITLDAAGSTDEKTFRQSQYDLLADCVRNHMDMAAVYAMLREASI